MSQISIPSTTTREIPSGGTKKNDDDDTASMTSLGKSSEGEIGSAIERHGTERVFFCC
jgi:hypothetical protein